MQVEVHSFKGSKGAKKCVRYITKDSNFTISGRKNRGFDHLMTPVPMMAKGPLLPSLGPKLLLFPGCRDKEEVEEEPSLKDRHDLVIVAETEEELQRRYLAWKEKMEQGGLHLNMSKAEGMMSSKIGREEINLRSEDGRRIQQNTEFKYLGSVFTEERGTEQAVRQRVKRVWRKWKEVIGIVLDKIPLKLKIKVYKTVLRRVLLYGAETWALRRKEERLLERTEMRMVRWRAGISLRERESADIRRMAGICCIRETAREARLRYFGHVKRGAEEGPVRRAMEMEVRGRRSVRRQRKRWKDTVKEDMRALGTMKEETQDRS
ncbi:uncharacterized protein [Penaeus vannamei]|uniref:uncharacterized protein n=1 Tax=Penaeus vannamei TaxID=6689 RepID=UPI00387F97B2